MSEENELELNQKKDLLREQIIDKNYDQDEFIQFCQDKKENGDDMSNWTLEELKQVIKDFISAHAKEHADKEEKDKKNEEEKKKEEEIKQGIDEIKGKTKVEEKQTKTIEITCREIKKTPLNDKSITVKVKDPKSIETGFLTANYVNYEVETVEVSFLVRRRYSDFEWLRQMLVKYNPGYMVPPLPNKKIGQRRFEADFIEKRMKFLQKFIDAVLQHEIFKSCECLVAFLQMTDRGQFESKMKELSSYQPSPYIEDFKTFSGKIIISSEEEDHEKYFKNINNYFRIQSQLFDRLNFNMKNYHQNIRFACENLQDIQKDFEVLHLLNTRVLMKEQITKTYEEFGIFFKNWKRTVYKQNELVKTQVRDFFKFIRMECSSYDELIRHRESIKDAYISEQTRLTAKKEKLWNQMDVTKWDIVDEFNKVDHALLMKDKPYAIATMCSKETQNLEKLKKQLGYANRMNIEELKKVIKINCEKFTTNLKKFVDEFYPTLTDAINVWSGLATFINSY